MKNIIFLIGILLLMLSVSAQDNSLYQIDFLQRRIDSVTATPVSALSSAKTSSNYGGAGNAFMLMPLTMQGAQFCGSSSLTQTQKASLLGSITLYPARTILKIGRMSNGQFSPTPLMAVMVGDKFALTDYAFMNDFFKFGFPPVIPQTLQLDSFMVWPAYENGVSLFAELAPVRIKKLYHFKNLFLGSLRNFSLLELEQPLGNFTGWQSIGFNNDDDFFRDRVFQKLSLSLLFSAPPPAYTRGDTLYHWYARVSEFGNEFTTFGNFSGPNLIGPTFGFTTNTFNGCVPAFNETGSPFFYTNNSDSCITYAVSAVLPNPNFQSRITADVFSAFEKIISNTTTSVTTIFPDLFSIYPNPVANELFIKLKSPLKMHEMRIIDLNGVVVKRIRNINRNSIDVSTLQNGVYFFQIINDTEILTHKFIKK